ncbi:YihY/virulence factor BrkB family protein [Streptobacillus moniliformis]|uniref:Ribonuclease BN n=1 Tax=Streptobacillus moniliformis (strain ATCC 14647 / DSM 12112 / NCTC 10651 / 9901) TaxID=519441 RepID=D1AYB0_STRM9|nr:YihY/virulence factor BrkB family protein [Streptobacillus moniliformis]ACZ01286.1 ribonuclease BN [Streptobacillus moniliformis DSM 12112]AVL42359.1 YihY/virulence factor BrkB family protein [Streptobacillus moniliformis]QXW66025.1 YihY/virulence factor BrkB family protein [Streptobacillus moniliformis]SQA13556.1 YihY family inner membrane protein [Streptobacillus moniliformis]
MIYNKEKVISMVKIYFKKYFSKDLSLLASNLTYMMILTIFPFFAIILGIAKGFGLDEKLIAQVNALLPQNEQVLAYILETTNNLIENARGGILTGLGILILIFSVISMFDLLENTFNDIWNVRKNRNFTSKIISYTALVFITPIFILLILASSSVLVEFIKSFADISNLTKYILKVFNMFMRMMFISGLFILIPNKRVKILPAIIGAAISDIGLNILYVIYVYLQFSISRYNIIYGSLAFIPIFLIWIKYAWTIILIGAQITYTIQTSKELVEEDFEMSLSMKKKIGVYIMYILSDRFNKLENPLDMNALKLYTGISEKALNKSILLLQDYELINEVLDENNELEYYQININPNKLSYGLFNSIIENEGIDDKYILEDMPSERREEFEKISNELTYYNDKIINEE